MLSNFRALILPSLICASLAITGCGGGSGGGGSSSSASATISGLIIDSGGLPVSDVTITAGTATTTTKTDGSYSLTVTPSTSLKVDAHKTGFVTTFDVIPLADGQSMPVDFTLQTVGMTNALTNLTTTNTSASNGDGVVIVKFPANSIVDSSGNPVNSASVDVTTSKPSAPNYSDSFPGMFIGTRAGSDKAIESFGYANIDITCGAAKCNLGTGKTAELALPVDPAADPGTATIELWSLNTTSGKWEYESDATRDATGVPVVYRANVSHFSAYNLDRPIQDKTELKVTVTNGGSAVSGAAVVVKSTSTVGAQWEGRGVSSADGTYTFAEIPQGTVYVSAVKGSLKGVGYSYDVTSPGKATMTIALTQMISKQVFFYHLVGGVKTPLAGIPVFAYAFKQGVGSPDFIVFTGADGKATIDFASGMTTYNISANTTISGVSITGSSSTTEANIPSEIELK